LPIITDPPAPKKNVLVVGGGNSALQAVLEVAPIARKVQAITRSGWTGEPAKIDAVNRFENVEMLPPSNIVRIDGGDALESVVVESVGDGEQRSLDIDLVFV
jgi:thioredoxin reductase